MFNRATTEAKRRLGQALPRPVYQWMRGTHKRVRSLINRPRIARIEALAAAKPLMLKVETIDICNAACIFCGYPTMERKKGTMSPETFEKVARDYSELGGGALTLTPIVGDVLLDKHLMSRLKVLERYPNINQVSITTNGIHLRKFSDADVETLLERLYMFQFSVGGLDRETYAKLFAVDEFETVHAQMLRVIAMKKKIRSPVILHFAFRTNDAGFEKHHAGELAAFRAEGVEITHIHEYHNFGGAMTEAGKEQLSVATQAAPKTVRCGVAAQGMAVQWDGKVSACACVDMQSNGLVVGNVDKDSLSGIWSGKRRLAVLNAFERGKLPPLCQNCTAYIPADELFGGPACEAVEAHKPLPLRYYLDFSGG